MTTILPDDLVEDGDSRIVLLVLDGLGGLPHPDTGRTELETAATPHLDRLARRSALGLMEPVGTGITPGSGPGHLGLFGYDPLRWNIGRGVLSALGVGFDLQVGDLAVRLNFASLDDAGRITDRRAGRPNDTENQRLIEKLRAGVRAPDGVQLFFESEKEHRAVLILRGDGLAAELGDTDPQQTGVPPLPVSALESAAQATAQLVQRILDDALKVLADERTANGILARGFADYRRYPTFEERFRLRAQAIARYPMYRGVAKLLGMAAHPGTATDEESIDVLAGSLNDYDFHFVHFKAIDSRGEDGDFAAKVGAIEAIDALVERVVDLKPDVLVVTGDHSTPSQSRAHTWHPVPVLLASPWCRAAEVPGFGERACLQGELGTFEAKHLMTLALAHAGRLAKYGA